MKKRQMFGKPKQPLKTVEETVLVCAKWLIEAFDFTPGN